MFSKAHPLSQVVVFETNPLTFFYLRLNLFMNNINVLISEELGLRPGVPGIYPVFGGVGGGDAPFIFTASDSSPGRSQNHINTIL